MPFFEAFFRKHAKMARVIPRNASLDDIEVPSCLLSSMLADQKQNGAARTANSSDTLKGRHPKNGIRSAGLGKFAVRCVGCKISGHKTLGQNCEKRKSAYFTFVTEVLMRASFDPGQICLDESSLQRA
jgi:hypothetical protein